MNSSNKFRRFCVLLLCSLGSLQAQITSGKINVAVVDSSGALLRRGVPCWRIIVQPHPNQFEVHTKRNLAFPARSSHVERSPESPSSHPWLTWKGSVKSGPRGWNEVMNQERQAHQGCIGKWQA